MFENKIKNTLFVMVVLTCLGAGLLPAQEKADLILAGGTVYTLEGGNRTAEAVAVSGGRIVYVGGVEGARPYSGDGTRWIDIEGKTVLPGLVDAHAHVKSLGRYLANLRLDGTQSAGEIRSMVLETQKRQPAGRWIRGRGWDQNDWEMKEFPTWRDLEGTENNPVYLRRVDGHASWVNKTALELCGITRDTPDPPGGLILRDEAGEPTGVFIDEASNLVSDRIPDPTPDELDQWVLSALRHCNGLGLTGIHDAGTTAEELESYERLHGRGQFTARVYCMLDSDSEDFLEEEFRKGPREIAGGRVTVRAVKDLADGALGSRGAAMLAPYSDDPGNTGLLVSDPQDIERLSRRALQAGFQMCTHAIGDRGVRVVLDAYEKSLGAGASGDHRFRIEHAQVISPDDIPRFRKLGVIPAMQPTHATSDMYWAQERVGKERIRGAYAWRTLLDDGNRMPFGSDFPVESANPLWGIYAAVTREDHKGWPQGGWYPDQRLTALEAVRGFTIDAAYGEFAEGKRGTIEVGKQADLTVLDRNIFEIPAREILETRVTHTIVGGDVVFEQPAVD